MHVYLAFGVFFSSKLNHVGSLALPSLPVKALTKPPWCRANTRARCGSFNKSQGYIFFAFSSNCLCLSPEQCTPQGKENSLYQQYGTKKKTEKSLCNGPYSQRTSNGMAACGNEEDLTGLANCGGPKEGDQETVMRIDFLVQTRGASKSIQNTADSKWFFVTEAPFACEKTKFLQDIQTWGQGSEVFLKATTLPSWKNSTKTMVHTVQSSDTP